MSEDFRERLDCLDRMASAAPQGLLDHRATPVRPALQAAPVSAALLELPALPVRLDPQVARAQQEQRALLARRD